MKRNFGALNKQLGQGMTEYIIIVALIAIAAIGVFGAFGDVVKNQTAAMAQELAGENGNVANDRAGDRGQAAEDSANNNSTLKSFDQQ